MTIKKGHTMGRTRKDGSCLEHGRKVPCQLCFFGVTKKQMAEAIKVLDRPVKEEAK